VKRSDVGLAVAAAKAVASGLGLDVHDAIVLNNSNKLALRLVPCDVFARVAPQAQQIAQFEIDLARRLAQSGSPVAALEPRVEPRVYARGGFVVTLWRYYEPVAPEVPPLQYRDALARLHAGMKTIDLPAPHFTDRVAEAQQLVAEPDLTPALPATDRELLSSALRDLRREIVNRHAPEQLLHGEPHPGNLLSTQNGPLFVDLETCCRGPVEFDLAHAPEEIGELYPGADPGLIRDCRALVLAMVSAWRWDRNDQFPDGQRMGVELVRQLRTALDR
jgi:aminoglycoside phosphotransferase (APT) family kinase protein